METQFTTYTLETDMFRLSLGTTSRADLNQVEANTNFWMVPERCTGAERIFSGGIIDCDKS